MLTLAITKQSWCHPKPSRCETIDYHTSNSRECMKVSGEALQLHTVYKEPYFLLHVTRESISVPKVPQCVSKLKSYWCH